MAAPAATRGPARKPVDGDLAPEGHAASRPLYQQELLYSLGWLIRMRWLAGVGVLAGTLVATTVLHLPIPPKPLYALGLGILAYNALLAYLLRVLTRSRKGTESSFAWFARLQIGLDWAGTTVLMHFSGGIESPAILFFLPHVAIASLILPHRRGFAYVTFAPVLVTGLALFEAFGILHHVRLLEPAQYRDPYYVGGVLFFFSGTAYAIAFFAGSIARRLRRREDEISGLYDSMRATTSTLELTAVLQRLTEATARVLGCKGASIRLLDREGRHLEMAAIHGLSPAYAEKAPIELGKALIDQEALSGRPVLVRDAPRDPRVRHPDKMREEGVETILVAPLVGRSGPIGVLRAYGAKSHRFTRRDADFLAAVAVQGAVALENAKAYESLTRLNEDKSRFLRIVTHELRSPLQVTQSLLAVLERGYAGPLGAQQSDLMGRAVRRLAALEVLVDDLLDLAAGKADAFSPSERCVLSLGEVVEEVFNRSKPSAEGKGIGLRLEAPSEPLEVWGDRREVERMVENLVANAIKYTREGTVALTIEGEAEWVRLAVSDTGIGIPADALPRLFEEFYRAPNAKALDETGTGLGLAIVQDLAARYDGRIEVESSEGTGSRFTLVLPRAVHAPAAP
ncbi:MAG: GAF domain-containing sensor histidine kinase [Acidobacteriota bacterium]